MFKVVILRKNARETNDTNTVRFFLLFSDKKRTLHEFSIKSTTLVLQLMMRKD